MARDTERGAAPRKKNRWQERKNGATFFFFFFFFYDVQTIGTTERAGKVRQ
jgi:hypothetical protein